LQQQFAAAQANIQILDQKLQSSSAEALMSKEKLAAMEAEVKKESDLAAALQQQLAQLAKNNQIAQDEKQKLAGQLRLAQVEKRAATERAALMQQQVQAERAEKAQLAEGFKALATNSGALTQEIRENRALAPNTIFSDFVTNRVQARLLASRSGMFGMDASKSKTAETVLVTDGANIYALCHVQDTPLTLWDPGTDWAGLDGTLVHNQAQVPIHSLSFHIQDPRVVFMPVTQSEARQLGCKVYPISSDPYKFQDAVLVGAQEGYYGQCSFQMDLNTPQYVKLDRNLLKGLFGKFNPSRGDLVFSRTGELLGIMANSTYCLMLHDFTATATFQFGPDVRAQRTGGALSRLYSYVFNLPLRLK
jgi:regulator of replication initiation timing